MSHHGIFTVPRFVGIGARLTYAKHQSYSYVCPRCFPRYTTRGGMGAPERIGWTSIVGRLYSNKSSISIYMIQSFQGRYTPVCDPGRLSLLGLRSQFRGKWLYFWVLLSPGRVCGTKGIGHVAGWGALKYAPWIQGIFRGLISIRQILRNTS